MWRNPFSVTRLPSDTVGSCFPITSLLSNLILRLSNIFGCNAFGLVSRKIREAVLIQDGRNSCRCCGRNEFRPPIDIAVGH